MNDRYVGPKARHVKTNFNLVNPFHDAVNVETVSTRSPYDRTVIAGKLTIGTTAVERNTTNTTSVVVRNPLPGTKIWSTLVYFGEITAHILEAIGTYLF